jgi:F-type H+-transporting ATPase subunit b
MLNVFATLIWAAEEGSEEASGIDLLLPVTEELIAGIIAFAIVFFFVWKFAVPAFNETLAKRQEAIKGQLAEAEQKNQEAESLLGDYRQQLAQSKEEANQIIEEARQTAEAVRQDTVAKAQTEAEEIVARARQEAEAEAARALESARSEVANLSVDLAEKVVGQSLDRERQLGLVNDYLTELESD